MNEKSKVQNGSHDLTPSYVRKLHKHSQTLWNWCMHVHAVKSSGRCHNNQLSLKREGLGSGDYEDGTKGIFTFFGNKAFFVVGRVIS